MKAIFTSSLIAIVFVSAPLVVVQAPVVEAGANTTDQVIAKLIQCESSGDPKAYNPEDNDGLPKYGILQFRLETFREQAIKYDILPKDADFESLVWDESLQIDVAYRMIEDGKVKRWGCSRVL